MNIGYVLFGTLSKTKRIYWELQLFARPREWSDGITFFNFNINWDGYKSEHTPAFQIELTILNVYNQLLINQNNFDIESYE
jgi:hypothetical protein